ncbi:MAG: SMC-Scp complex subunit ScpB [Nitrososphaerales archaeon]|nr:SMC-Scp complex subunit ScpB [Nitrososphaerales archaeon]
MSEAPSKLQLQEPPDVLEGKQSKEEAQEEKQSKDMVAKVEAALYSAGRPLDAEQLAKAAGTVSARKAMMIARDIQKAVNTSMRALEVVEYPGPRFAMQLRADFTQVARKFATRPLLSKAALRTLSYIAYFQPITSSELVLRRSSSVYEHLRELQDVGFVIWERQGRGRAFRTTSRFSDYFGLSSDVDAMKKQLKGRGLTLS